MSKRERVEYPIHWVSVKTNVAYAQAKNCLLCVHIGSVAVMMGVGTRPKGRGALLELLTPCQKFRWSGGCWYEMSYAERQAFLAARGKQDAT